MKKDKAVIIGGSIAGLLTARVLAENFESVTIIESDKLPLEAAKRKGVPQSVQPHVLFTKGYRILEELFPDIGNDLTAAGALSIDWVREFHVYIQGKWNFNSSQHSDIISFTCSRPLLEWVIRKRLQEFSQVEFLEQHRVIGLLADKNNKQVTGLRLKPLVKNGYQKFTASLVVDAGGRRSNAPEWLKNLGFKAPPETVINPHLGYATKRYKKPSGFNDDWKVMLISQEPPDNKRLGYLASIEGDELIATLGGYGGDFPPLDHQGFIEFARSLPSDKFYETIKNAEPVSPIYAHRATSNRQRHYEQIDLPDGFVTLGDAVCALCPVYGQGMTVSALSAMVLKDCLKEDKLIPHQFQKKLAKSNNYHWMLATGSDSRFPTTAGRSNPSPISKILGWYNQRLMETINQDADLYSLFIEISHLLKSPLALYHPRVFLKVLSS
ncbi:MAG: monooxygenase [Rivularia sp. (in: Bacteria)]|nr:monooxygenase [Rivularia sp. MS3]